jgi:hypothetical protein
MFVSASGTSSVVDADFRMRVKSREALFVVLGGCREEFVSTADFPISTSPRIIKNRFAPHGSRFVSLQIVALRMKSVGNIQKITAAMKMVAASRLKGAQIKMERSRGIVEPMFRLLGDQPGETFDFSSAFFFLLRGRSASHAHTPYTHGF